MEKELVLPQHEEQPNVDAQRAIVEALAVGRTTLSTHLAQQGEQLRRAEEYAHDAHDSVGRANDVLRNLTWTGWLTNRFFLRRTATIITSVHSSAGSTVTPTTSRTKDPKSSPSSSPPPPPPLEYAMESLPAACRPAAQAIQNYHAHVRLLFVQQPQKKPHSLSSSSSSSSSSSTAKVVVCDALYKAAQQALLQSSHAEVVVQQQQQQQPPPRDIEEENRRRRNRALQRLTRDLQSLRSLQQQLQQEQQEQLQTQLQQHQFTTTSSATLASTSSPTISPSSSSTTIPNHDHDHTFPKVVVPDFDDLHDDPKQHVKPKNQTQPQHLTLNHHQRVVVEQQQQDQQDAHLTFLSQHLTELVHVADQIGSTILEHQQSLDRLHDQNDSLLVETQHVTRRAERLVDSYNNSWTLPNVSMMMMPWTSAHNNSNSSNSSSHRSTVRVALYHEASRTYLSSSLQGTVTLVRHDHHDHDGVAVDHHHHDNPQRLLWFDMIPRGSLFVAFQHVPTGKWLGQNLLGQLVCTSPKRTHRHEWQVDVYENENNDHKDHPHYTPSLARMSSIQSASATLLCASAGWGAGGYLWIHPYGTDNDDQTITTTITTADTSTTTSSSSSNTTPDPIIAPTLRIGGCQLADQKRAARFMILQHNHNIQPSSTSQSMN